MSVLRVILFIILGVLAFVGGVNLTMTIPKMLLRAKVRRIAKKLDDCKCGSSDVEIMVNNRDHSDVRIACCKCHRIVMHGDIAKRWNEGESDDGDE